MEDMMMTSGQGFEGYEVESYLGFVNGQIALGSNFYQTLATNIAEMTAQESTRFTNKLQQASEIALEKLTEVAERRGANAIIGVALNYTEFSSNSIGTIASGTAVKLRKKELKDRVLLKKLYVTNYYTKLIPRPIKVTFHSNRNGTKMSVDFMNYNMDEILAIRVDIVLTTYYDETIELTNVDFTFAKNNISLLESTCIECDIPEKNVQLIKTAKVYVRKYVTSRNIVTCTEQAISTPLTYQRLENLKKKRGVDAIVKYQSNGMIWTCNCGCINKISDAECILCGRKENDLKGDQSFDYEQMISEMMTMKNVSEMKNVLMKYIKEINPEARMELLQTMESALQYEKTRGDMKEFVIDKIEKVFEA